MVFTRRFMQQVTLGFNNFFCAMGGMFTQY